MEGEKKHACACGGTCGCEKQPEETTPNEGEVLALAAINAMRPEKKEQPKADESLSAAVDGFLNTCSEAGEDPMEVVAHIARREGLEISGEPPENADKRRTYELLRAVVTRLVTDLSASLAEECEFDTDHLSDLVLNTLNFGRRVPQGRRARVGLIPMRIRYAFSF